MPVVAIFGASGFVGSTLFERLLANGEYDVRPMIHNSGNAWRLARRGEPLHRVNILSTDEVDEALKDVTHVVNCTRGPEEVMNRGLRNLLQASQRHKVERFVHISSVSVYDGPFPQEPIDESFSQYAIAPSYGATKLAQDQMVESAAKRGLPTVVLCPPNISGPYSAYMSELVDLIRAGQIALVDGGEAVCPLVDVENLAYGIERALTCQDVSGQRIFVSDPQELSWATVLQSLAELAGVEEPLPTIESDQAKALTATGRAPRKSLMRAAKRVISPEVRRALKQDPVWESLIVASRKLGKKMPGGIQNMLRSSDDHKVPRIRLAGGGFESKPLTQQMRGARYSAERSKSLLDYRPPVSSEQSLTAFHNWYRAFRGLDTDAAELFQLIG